MQPWLVGLSGCVLACESKGRQFNSQSRALAGLGRRPGPQQVEAGEAATH